MRCRLSRMLSLTMLCLISSPLLAQGVAEAEAQAMDAQGMAQMYASMGNPASAARMSDSDATCEQLYAESAYLEARVAALPKAEDPMQASMKMQEEMLQAQKKMMGGMRAKSMASGLLGMVPGVGGIAGGLASSAMSRGPNLDAMGQAQRKAMTQMQESTQAMMAVSQLQMRNSHVTQLFLSRSCKVSTLDPEAITAARARLEQGEAETPARPAPAAVGDAPAVGASQ